jgi:hypothetical protein
MAGTSPAMTKEDCLVRFDRRAIRAKLARWLGK